MCLCLETFIRQHHPNVGKGSCLPILVYNGTRIKYYSYKTQFLIVQIWQNLPLVILRMYINGIEINILSLEHYGYYAYHQLEVQVLGLWLTEECAPYWPSFLDMKL